jgi:hypothetical protein
MHSGQDIGPDVLPSWKVATCKTGLKGKVYLKGGKKASKMGDSWGQ